MLSQAISFYSTVWNFRLTFQSLSLNDCAVSGHGSQVENKDGKEKDGFDEGK